MVITFSSPFEGQMGSSRNLLAVGICAAYKYKKRVLILDTFFAGNNLESMLMQSESRQTSFFTDEFGVDALIRAKSYSGIHPETIRNTSYTFLDGALSFLPGTRQTNREIFLHSIENQYETIIAEALKEWDLILIDLDMTIQMMASKLNQSADLKVVTLSQNPHALTRYFLKSNQDMLQKSLYLLGNYDKESRYNKTNLCHLYPNLNQKNTMIVPYSSPWRDAGYEAMAIHYMIRYIDVPDKSRHADFIHSIDQIVGRILKKGGE